MVTGLGKDQDLVLGKRDSIMAVETIVSTMEVIETITEVVEFHNLLVVRDLVVLLHGKVTVTPTMVRHVRRYRLHLEKQPNTPCL